MIDLKDAQRFAEEQENKPVLMYIYSYFDKKMDTFNQPMVSQEDPSYMYQAVKTGVVKGKIGVAEAQDLVFVQLGTFDIKSGKIIAFDEPLIILECANAIPSVKGNDA